MRIGMIAQSMSRAAGGVGEAMRMDAEAIQAVEGTRCVEIFAAADEHSLEDISHYTTMPVHVFSTIGPMRFRYAPKLANSLVAANLDIVHVHGIWSPIGLSVLAWHRRTGRPFIVAPHGMLESYILKRSRGLKKLVSMLFQDRLMRKAAAIHALTKTEHDQALKQHSKLLKVAVIPNYVQPPKGGQFQAPDWWNHTFAQKTVFLFFGRLHSKKGVPELLAAWAQLSNEDAVFRMNAVLVFCGWVDDLNNFDTDVAAIAARHENILFAGAQFGEDKWRSIAAASFMVLPSKSEGLPMAILEAWSVGIPTIQSPECNLPEGFKNGAAITCGPTENSIAQALRTAMSLPPEERARRGVVARKIVAHRYSRESIGSELCNLYDAVCKSDCVT